MSNNRKSLPPRLQPRLAPANAASNFNMGVPDPSSRIFHPNVSTPYGASHRDSYEDQKLSSLLRKMMREDATSRTIGPDLKAAREYIENPVHARSVYKQAESAMNKLQELFYKDIGKGLKMDVAEVIGLLGSVLGRVDAFKFVKWVFNCISGAPSDLVKTFYLMSLQKAFEVDSRTPEVSRFGETVEECMENLCKILSEVDEADLLIAVVNALMAISLNYTSALMPHFEETVDILIGWRLEPTSSSKIVNFTTKVLLSMHYFWTCNSGHTVKIMGQFVDDIEAYRSDFDALRLNDQSNDEPFKQTHEVFDKIIPLINVFGVLTKALKQDCLHTSFRPVIYKSVNRIFGCVRALSQSYFSAPLIGECNALICSLMETSSALVIGDNTPDQSNDDTLSEHVFSYILDILASDTAFTVEVISSCLKTLSCVVKESSGQIPLHLIESLLVENNCFRRLRCCEDDEIVSESLLVYENVLSIKDVPTLETVYKIILSEVQVCMQCLVESNSWAEGERSETSTPKSAVSVYLVSDPYHFDLEASDPDLASEVIVFNLTALSPLSSQKTSLIVNYALKPSLFDLFCKKLRFFCLDFGRSYPEVQFAILSLLFRHSSASSHFLASCTTDESKSPLAQNSFSFSQPTRNHFFDSCELVTLCMASKHLNSDTLALCLNWLTEILTSMTQDSVIDSERSKKIFHFPQFRKMVHAAVESLSTTSCSEVHELFAEFAVGLIHCERTPPQLMHEIGSVCLLMLQNNNQKIIDLYSDLISHLPIGAFQNVELVGSNSKTTAVSSFSETRRQLMRLEPSTQLLPYDFKFLLNGVFTELEASQLVSGENLQTFFHRFCDKKLGEKFPTISWWNAAQCKDVTWFYGLWEIANVCIVGKLKTALGKASETFSGFESVLRSHCASVRGSMPREEKTKLVSLDHLDSFEKPSRILLFLDCLEKQIYNASEGLVCSLPVANKTARTFFRTNRHVCKTWFKQIRIHAACLAQAVNDPAAVLHHVRSYFCELEANEKATGDFAMELCLLAYWAFMQLNACDSLQGFNVFFTKKFGKPFPFSDLFHLQSKGCFEDALYLYGCRLTGSKPQSDLFEVKRAQDLSAEKNNAEFSDKNPMLRKFLLSQCSAIARSIHLQEEFLTVCEGLQAASESESSSRSDLTSLLEDELNHVKLLQSFDQLDFLDTQKKRTEICASGNEGVLSCSVPEWTFGNLNKGIELCAINNLCSALKFKRKIPTELDEASSDKDSTICTDSESLQKASDDLNAVIHWMSGQAVNRCSKTFVNEMIALNKMVSLTKQILRDKPLKLKESNSLFFPDCVSRPDLNTFSAWFRGLEMDNLKQKLLKNSTSEMDQPDDSSTILHYRLNLVRLLRKSNCPRRATNMLLCAEDKDRLTKSALISDLNSFSPNLLNLKVGLEQIKESAKLLLILGDETGAMDKLSSLILMFIKNASISEPAFISKVILTLAKVISLDGNKTLNFDQESNSATSVDGLCTHLLDIIGNHQITHFQPLGAALSGSSIVDKREKVVSALYYLAVGFDPDSAKIWYRLASWCFKFGKKTVTQACNDSKLLSPEEHFQVQTFVDSLQIDESKRAQVLEVLARPHFNAWQDEDISLTGYADGGEVVRRQMLSIAPELKDNAELESMMLVWQSACNRIFSLYKLAADAYFKYLTFETSLSSETQVTATLRLLRILVNHAWELQDCLETGFKSTPTKPWRAIIPQLFSRLNHPEAYVRKSVTDLLNRIALDTPHLIVYPVIVGCEQKISEGKLRSKSGRFISNDSRLGDSQEDTSVHAPKDSESSDGTLRDDDSDLNEGLKGVIGSSDTESLVQSQRDMGGKVEGDFANMSLAQGSQDYDAEVIVDEAEDDEDEDEVDLNELYSSRVEIEHCYSLLLDSVNRSDSQLVSDLKLFVDELRRVSVLWDELWLSAFMYYSGEAVKAINAVEHERKRLDRNKLLSLAEKQSILASKYSAYMNPVIFVFDQILELTSRSPETVHENWFVSTYLDRIKEALAKLKNPENVRKPAAAWEPFNSLHQELSTRSSKKSSLNLHLKSIAPKLSSFNNTCVPLILSETSELITIQSFHDDILIMPTKTKPKKITVLGNDGVNYSYLFKGLEDLHLDERIMQFLSIVNTMFDKNNKEDKSCCYRARNYAVTPLGPRSGLIQWVDGAVPLFGLYKKWQQREAYAAALKKQAAAQQVLAAKGPGQIQDSTMLQVPPVPKPSELFQEKISACLAANDVPESTPRRDWPLKVVRQVLDELLKETPNHLLWREMWCNCTNSDEWWLTVQQYNCSVAVMSVVGYAIGLGDRHLDNILVDLATGEVVHIDYNICFEKGRNLRVPEKVPFRLTQNLLAALGVSGYEGKFRVVAENVLKTLKKGRETLLTLLEAFVYDPLVDWTTQTSDLGGFIGALQFKKNNEALRMSKKQLDFDTALSLLCAKIIEIRSLWMKNKDEVLKVLKMIPERLASLKECLKIYLEKDQEKSLIHSSLQFLADAEKDESHAFWTLESRDANAAFYQCIEDEFTAKLESQMSSYKTLLDKFSEVYSHNHRLFLLDIMSDFGDGDLIPPAGYMESRTYLASVSQLQLLDDCQTSDLESQAFLKAQSNASLQLAQLLTEFLAIVQPNTSGTVIANVGRCLDKLKDAKTEDEEPMFEMAALEDIISYPTDVAALALRIDSSLISELRAENDAIVRLSNKLIPLTTDLKASHSQNVLNERLLSFISKSTKEFSAATASVVLNYLSTFANQYMQMEVAAFSASDEILKNSKSVEGDWFLDEIESLAGTLKTLAKFAQFYISMGTEYSPLPVHLVEPVIASLSIYSSVTEFYQNVASNILTEVVSQLFNLPLDDKNISEIVKKLEDTYLEAENLVVIIETTGAGESELQTRVESLIETVTSFSADFDSFLPLILQSFNQLASSFESLVLRATQSEAPEEMESMLQYFGALKVSEQVQKVSVADIKVPPQHSKTWMKCSSVKAIASCLISLFRSVSMLKHLSRFHHSSPQDLEHVRMQFLQCLEPIRLFVSSFVRKQVIGIPSKCIAHFTLHCAKALGLDSAVHFCDFSSETESVKEVKFEFVDQKIREHLKNSLEITERDFNNVFTIFSELEAVCRQSAQTSHIENQLSLHRHQFQILRNVANKFEWSYYHLLILAGKPASDFLTGNRFAAIEAIKAKLLELSNANSQALNSLQALKSKEEKIEARLKWAAGLYKESLERFSGLKTARDQYVQERMKRTENLILTSKMLLQFEELQSWSPQATQVLVGGCKELIDLVAKLRTHRGQKIDISLVERALINRLTATSDQFKSDETTRSKLLERLRTSETSVKNQVDSSWQNLVKARDETKSSVQPLKTSLNVHNSLMKELKSLMRPLNKDDVLLKSSGKSVFNQVRQYVLTHNKFTDLVSQMYSSINPIIANVSILKRNPSHLDSLVDIVKTLNQLTPSVYADLIALNQPIKSSDNQSSAEVAGIKGLNNMTSKGTSSLFASASSRLLSPNRKGSSKLQKVQSGVSAEVKRDPKTGKALQERNTYAISVWRKVRSKLDGVVETSAFDSHVFSTSSVSGSKKLAVPEQVDFIIKEAIDPNNLAQMYEGWTAWV